MVPNLRDAAWLQDARLQKLFAVIVAAGGEARVAGGAVRNALMGLPLSDIDLATTLLPEQLMSVCAAAGMKVYPTGIDHGTLTVVHDGAVFEVTTLRLDVATDGRHAEVVFTADWAADAARRDFTMNALYCDAHGEIYDFTNGYADIIARCVRFVGDPAQRIVEDHLRILRFFRFDARFGFGTIDPAGLAACKKLRKGIAALSVERIRVEMLKLLEGAGAGRTLDIMSKVGILNFIMPCTDDLAIVDRLPRDGLLRLIAIAAEPSGLKDTLKLSNDEALRIKNVINAPRLSPVLRDAERRVILYQIGADCWRDRVALDQARGSAEFDWDGLMDFPNHWPILRFPLAGQDLLDRGFVPGPEVGGILAQVEDWWLANDFEPGHDVLIELALKLKRTNYG